MDTLPALLALLPLLAAHAFAGRLKALDVRPRSRWLSAAGGVSVAYVFVHILPELAAVEAHLADATPDHLPVGELAVYTVALAGLTGFYGLERLIIAHRPGPRDADRPEAPPPGIFALHLGSFALYNVLIGYLLLHREQPGLWSLALYAAAMTLHLVVVDRGLATHHGRAYRRTGRWVLVTALAAGFGVGLAVDVSEAVLAAFFALLAGATILNVMKEELPDEQASRFGPFLIGAAGFAALLMAAA
ncbi:ZIP family transporter [Caenispirillum salinarum]|nr:hypothetical protein [Caenispirillum salinarum]